MAFLGHPATHGGPVSRIDTHAAAVFLAGTRVFKVKRAVRFPFLDFSTLERRHDACAQELEANRPFSPGLYRRIVAITREADGALAIGGQGTAVEWAVEMIRFDETRTLDRLAERGAIDAALAEALGRAVATAHEGAPVADATAWITALATYIAQNDAAFRAAPELFAAPQVERLTRACRDAHGRLTPLLRARGACGLVRRGHGDLHLGNIALIEGQPVPFDALEFDPLMASGDVLYDLAFLLMDLLERRLAAAANIVFNRYLAQTRRDADLDGLAALPFFMALRAAIRAKVMAAQRHAGDGGAAARAARTYFALALALLDPGAPVLIAVGGLSGTGKSMLARALAADIPPAPGAVVLRSDVERKTLFGVALDHRLPREAYAPDATRRVYQRLAEQARRVIAAGHSVIVDAVFARDEERAEFAGLGARFAGLFLTADIATRIARVGARRGDASDADEAVVRAQDAYALGAIAWTMIDANGRPDDTLARARGALRDIIAAPASER